MEATRYNHPPRLSVSRFSLFCHSRKNTAHLDRNHTCFGKVVEGLEVIDQIRQGDKIEKVIIKDEEPATTA